MTVMITGVGSVAVLVLDAKKSAGWYHDKLGFEIVGAEGHSVFVRPGGSQTLMIHLCGKCNDWGNDEGQEGEPESGCNADRLECRGTKGQVS